MRLCPMSFGPLILGCAERISETPITKLGTTSNRQVALKRSVISLIADSKRVHPQQVAPGCFRPPQLRAEYTPQEPR
jgi:hypothetical protein